MKPALVFFAAALVLLAGCASEHASVRSVDGARSPLADPANNTLNSPTTGPSSSGLPGGPVGSPPTSSPGVPLVTGRP